jgi:hypothetical protein
VDADARKRRREAARQRIRRQRRLVLAGALALVGVVALALVLAGGGGDDGGGAAGQDTAKPPELPGGGREILPRSQVVGFYGAPQDEELGALGIGTPDQAGRRLRAQAKKYERAGGRPVLPAFELIAVVAANAPGGDGKYRTRQSGRVIRRYLAAARRAGAILILDIQPGRADFLGEIERLRPFLEEPDVSLALDPEWHVGPGELPGQVIGSVDAATVNRAAALLSQIVREHRLPQKLLLVHQFTGDMIQGRGQLVQPPGVALTVNVDGFGDRPNKLSKYREFSSAKPRFHNGFKLFYKEDTNLLGPSDVMRMRPRPEVVVYE